MDLLLDFVIWCKTVFVQIPQEDDEKNMQKKQNVASQFPQTGQRDSWQASSSFDSRTRKVLHETVFEGLESPPTNSSVFSTPFCEALFATNMLLCEKENSEWIELRSLNCNTKGPVSLSAWTLLISSVISRFLVGPYQIIYYWGKPSKLITVRKFKVLAGRDTP